MSVHRTLAHAGQAARAIPDPKDRTEAFLEIAAMQGIASDYLGQGADHSRVRAWLQEAVDCARGIDTMAGHVEYLARVIDQLSDGAIANQDSPPIAELYLRDIESVIEEARNATGLDAAPEDRASALCTLAQAVLGHLTQFEFSWEPRLPPILEDACSLAGVGSDPIETARLLLLVAHLQDSVAVFANDHDVPDAHILDGASRRTRDLAIEALGTARTTAQRIEDPVARAAALCSLAQGAAVKFGGASGTATPEDLLEDARGVAASLNDHAVRSSLLSRIVTIETECGLLVTGAATARSIPDPTRRAEMMAMVASACVEHGLLAEAIRLTESAGFSNRVPPELRAEIAEAQALAGDVDGAVATVQRLSGSDDRDGVLVELGDALVEKGENTRALAVAKAISDAELRDELIVGVVDSLRSVGDTDLAIQAAQGIDDADLRRQAFVGIGDHVLEELGPYDAREVASLIHNVADRDDLLSRIALAYAEDNDIEEAIATGMLITDGDLRRNSLTQIAVSNLINVENAVAYIEESVDDADDLRDMLTQIAVDTAHADGFDTAITVAERLPIPADQVSALLEIAEIQGTPW